MTAAVSTPRVGVYLRLSDDRDGEQTATKRQLEDCQRYAASRGWTVADVFEDVDLSGFKRSVHRPEFERLLQAVQAGAIDGVLAWKIDRLTRRQRDLVRLDEACEDTGGFIAAVVEGIDTNTSAGRFVAELLVAQARMESENQAVRIRRKHAELAQAGAVHLGGTRAFGYTSDRRELVEEEAALISEAAGRILAGEGVRGVCMDWSARGVTSPAGKPWTATSLRRALMSPLLTGHRRYGDRLVEGAWPPILDPAEGERVRAILGDSSRRTKGVTARRYLLTGFLLCGHCEQRLVARPRSDGVRRYVCARRPETVACGKLARLAEPVEDTIAEMIFTTLDGVDLGAYLERRDKPDQALHRAISDDEESLDQLSRDFYVERRLSRREFFTARDALQGRLEDSRRRLSRDSKALLLQQIAEGGAAFRDRWPGESLEWKRAVIDALVDHVTLMPARRGYNRFDESLVRVSWKF